MHDVCGLLHCSDNPQLLTMMPCSVDTVTRAQATSKTALASSQGAQLDCSLHCLPVMCQGADRPHTVYMFADCALCDVTVTACMRPAGVDGREVGGHFSDPAQGAAFQPCALLIMLQHKQSLPACLTWQSSSLSWRALDGFVVPTHIHCELPQLQLTLCLLLAAQGERWPGTEGCG